MENQEKTQEQTSKNAEDTVLFHSLEEKLSQDGNAEHHSHRHSEHRHSEHHHSGHRHKQHSSKKKKTHTKHKFKTFIKKNRGQIISLSLLFCALLAIILMIPNTLDKSKDVQDANGSLQDDSSLQLRVPFFTEEHTLVHDAVLSLLSAEAEEAQEVLAPFHETKGRLDIGFPVVLDFNVSDLPAGCFVTAIKVEVDENEDFSEPRVFRLSAEKRSVSIPYLKTGTQYFFRITFSFSNEQTLSSAGSFKTSATPRILSVDGLVNVRDIGGWTTRSGKTISQGKLFRGSEPDGAVEENYNVTSKGLLDALTVLGIRTDVDLRASSDHVDHTDALGANVTHTYYEIPMYDGIFDKEGSERIRALFSDLAKPEIYPVYLHCTYGTDRTGTVCYLLEALLGLSEEDLLTEYALTALYHKNTTVQSLSPLREGLNGYPGFTLQEKCENYLLSIGVTAEEISNIRTVFLTD